MRKMIQTSVLISVLGYAISFPANACNLWTDTLNGTEKMLDTTLMTGLGSWKPDYLLEERTTGDRTYLDGVDSGVKIDDPSFMNKDYSMYNGDKLTDLRTHESGIITGVHDQGTMDVLKSNGKMTRYEYVVFKVKK